MKLYTFNKENSINVSKTDIINYGISDFEYKYRRPKSHYAFDKELFELFNQLDKTNKITIEGTIEGIDFSVPVIFNLFTEQHRTKLVKKFYVYFFDKDYIKISESIPDLISSPNFPIELYNEYLQNKGKSMLEILKSNLDSLPESHWEEYRNKLKQEELVKNNRLESIRKVISSLNTIELETLFNKILVYNQKYEDYKFDEYNVQTCSRLYYYIGKYMEKYGRDVSDEYDEDFLGSAFILNDYLIRTYHGQGSFSKIEKIL